MFEEDDLSLIDSKFKKGNLKFAVIGHIEWINFLKVDSLPKSGVISHSQISYEQPAGGGAVIAKTLRELTHNKVHFFTSLGKDYHGKKSKNILKKMGIDLHVAWRDKPTRKGFSLTDSEGERSITIIGERLEPNFNDDLEWNLLRKMDGIFVTASDSRILKEARKAKTLCTTPRVGLNIINKSKISLDGLISSNLDPGEIFSLAELQNNHRFIIKTEGDRGGIVFPGGRFKAYKNNNPKVDSYGCGDSFAAGILYGLSSDWDIKKSLSLGKLLGRNCSENFGPYSTFSNIIN